MNTVWTVVVVLVAAWIGFSAYSVLARKAFIVDNLRDYGVPERWWPWLGTLKAVGAVGLLVGTAVPAIGVAAAAGLTLYFLGAIATVVRAHVYGHVLFPVLYLVPAAAAGAILLAT